MLSSRHRLRVLGPRTRQVLYSITKHAMRRSANEIGATSISFGRKRLAIRHRLLTEFFPPIESARQESLRTGDCDDDVKQAIANKIIALAKTGERNPDLLCERALEDIRQPLEAAR